MEAYRDFFFFFWGRLNDLSPCFTTAPRFRNMNWHSSKQLWELGANWTTSTWHSWKRFQKLSLEQTTLKTLLFQESYCCLSADFQRTINTWQQKLNLLLLLPGVFLIHCLLLCSFLLPRESLSHIAKQLSTFSPLDSNLRSCRKKRLSIPPCGLNFKHKYPA